MFDPFGGGVKGCLMKAIIVILLLPLAVWEKIKRAWRGH
jgi:hypothetical protein